MLCVKNHLFMFLFYFIFFYIILADLMLNQILILILDVYSLFQSKKKKEK